jgi:Tfp pilus assembly protein PilF
VVLPRLERDLGAQHYEVSVALTNLGALEAGQHQWEQARDHLSRAAEIKRATFGPDSPELVRTLANLAFVVEQAGDVAQARHLAGEAARIAQATLPLPHPLRRVIDELVHNLS